MENVTVHKSELLTALQSNMEAHTAIFEVAVTGYKAEAIRLLNQHLHAVETGKMRVISVHLPAPVNQTKDYQRAIRMVEMSVNNEIVLTESDFKAYVLDDWRWKDQFLTSNSHYSTTAAAYLED